MHQKPNQLDLLPEEHQLQHLPELSQLLDNVWFKHFMAVAFTERDKARTAVCEFPIGDIQQLLQMVQVRGEAAAYNRMYNEPYELYENLVLEAQENERRS